MASGPAFLAMSAQRPKRAVTDLLALIVTVHVGDVPEQAPLPVAERGAARRGRSEGRDHGVPRMESEQSAPPRIPAGLEVTAPVPRPIRVPVE